MLDIDCRQDSHVRLGDVQLDPFAETGHCADGERHFFATPEVPLLEEDMGHMVGLALDHKALHHSDLAIGRVDTITSVNSHLTQREPVMSDGLRRSVSRCRSL
jgi:hypothetical protein